MTAIIAGGTGLTGSFLLRELSADPAILRVISLSRKPLTTASPKLTEILISDLSKLSALDLKNRGGLFFCCLGTTIKTAGSKENFEKVDHDAILAFAKLAKAHDAKSFTLVSAMGANPKSRFFYNQVKGRTEDDVRALGLRSTIIFRPALLTGPRQEFRLAESIATKALIPITRIFSKQLQKKVITRAENLAARMLTEGKAAAAGVHVLMAKDI